MHAISGVHPRPGNTAAAVLSLVIPGAGQIYKGKLWIGLLWLALTTLGYLTMLGPVAGMLLHFLCVWQAYAMDTPE